VRSVQGRIRKVFRKQCRTHGQKTDKRGKAANGLIVWKSAGVKSNERQIGASRFCLDEENTWGLVFGDFRHQAFNDSQSHASKAWVSLEKPRRVVITFRLRYGCKADFT